MKGIYFISYREIKEQLASPMIYALTGLFCFLIGWLFFNYLVLSKDSYSETLTASVLMPIFGNMNFIFLLIVPLITMKSFAEEKKQHTLDLLLLSKMGHYQIIIGKFISAFLICVFIISFTFVFPLILAISGYSDWGLVFSSYVGLLFIVGSFISVGLFSSSLTNNPILAALITFCTLMGMMLLALSVNISYNFIVAQIFRYFSGAYHFQSFVRGLIKSEDVIYFLSFIFFFIFMTNRSLDSRNW